MGQLVTDRIILEASYFESNRQLRRAPGPERHKRTAKMRRRVADRDFPPLQFRKTAQGIVQHLKQPSAQPLFHRRREDKRIFLSWIRTPNRSQKILSQRRLRILACSTSWLATRLNLPRALSPCVMTTSPSLSPFFNGAHTGLFS